VTGFSSRRLQNPRKPRYALLNSPAAPSQAKHRRATVRFPLDHCAFDARRDGHEVLPAILIRRFRSVAPHFGEETTISPHHLRIFGCRPAHSFSHSASYWGTRPRVRIPLGLTPRPEGRSPAIVPLSWHRCSKKASSVLGEVGAEPDVSLAGNTDHVIDRGDVIHRLLSALFPFAEDGGQSSVTPKSLRSENNHSLRRICCRDGL